MLVDRRVFLIICLFKKFRLNLIGRSHSKAFMEKSFAIAKT